MENSSSTTKSPLPNEVVECLESVLQSKDHYKKLVGCAQRGNRELEDVRQEVRLGVISDFIENKETPENIESWINTLILHNIGKLRKDRIESPPTHAGTIEDLQKDEGKWTNHADLLPEGSIES